MSKETSNRNSTNYEAALSALKAVMSDPTPFEQYPDYEDPLECIRDSLYRYYAEQRIPVYTAAGKKAEEAEDKLHEKIRACPYLQHKEEGDVFPVSERVYSQEVFPEKSIVFPFFHQGEFLAFSGII